MDIIFRIILKVKYIFDKYTVSFRRKFFAYVVTQSAYSVGTGLKVGGFSRISNNTRLANNVSFNGMSILGNGQVNIGNNFHSGPGCIIITGYHNYDKGNAIPYDSTYIHKDVTIEDNVWLGTNVTILGGVTIGEGAIIQIGSVVVSNIPPLGIAGGHPAKVYKYRDQEHYYNLKQEGKFH